jgi:hypothetical protein
MAYDYTDDVAFALEMVAEYGRPVSFVKVSGTPGDATKPLHGPTVEPEILPGIMAAFVEPSSVIRLGQSTEQKPGLWKNTTQIALVAPVEGQDLATFTTITDSDGTGWKIEHVEALKPGLVTVLYYVGVKR